MMTKVFLAIVLVLSLLFVFSIGQAKDEDRIFYLSLIVYKNDTVKFREFSSIYGTPSNFPSEPPEENYTIIVLSKENKILFKAYLEIGFTAYPMPPEGEEEQEVPLNESEQYIRLPYFEDARKIQIFHNKKSIFKFDIPVKETPVKETKEKAQPLNIQLIIYSIILVAAVAGIVVLLLRRKPKTTVGQTIPYR